MKKNILIIAALFCAILIIGTASAGNPEIKGVSKHPKDTDGIPITVNADEPSVTTVTARTSTGTHKLDPIGGGFWKGHISPTEELDDVIIEADNKDGSEEQPYGHGGCPSRASYSDHPYTYSFAQVNLQQDPVEEFKTIFSLDTEVHEGTGVIGICVYPNPGYDPGQGALLKLLYNPNLWEIKHNSDWDYFGFGRHGGLNSIPLNGVKSIPIGSADYKRNTNSEQILMHIYDPSECARYTKEPKEPDDPQDTCWRRPGTTAPIPEFPTIALPVAAAIGLMLLFQHRKKKE